MADLDFSAEASGIWSEMEQLLMSDLLSQSTAETQQILNRLNMLVGDAIGSIEAEFEAHYKNIRSFQSFSKNFVTNNQELMMQNQLKAQGQFTALQQAYMFLDRAYEIVTGNKTEFVMTATGPGGELYKRVFSLEEILMQTHTFKEGNILISSTIQELKSMIKQEQYQVALDNNTMEVYKMFYSLTKVKKGGFNEGHLSEAIQRYMADVKSGKTINADSLMMNIMDSIQNSRFYEEGDLSRIIGQGELATTIETQVKNIGQKTNIITIGSYNTILNGLRRLQGLLSSGVVGAELQGKLESEMFSKSSDAPVKKINDALKEKAEVAIDQLLKQLALS